ncbi:hypothetical protein D5086_011913 [Populus alba]|uniref:Uncharacterized protein n=1 Tax=Populus alba TaxID=43335 RepID=A0ACC4C0V2_POPAL
MKYGERVLVLWLASSNKFRDSANEERKLLREQLDHKISRDELDNRDTTRYDEVLGFDGIRPEAKHLHEAHFLFRTLKLLYGDYLVTYPTHMISSYIILKSKSAAEAFELIGVELGFMFDVLFTKAMTGVFWRPRLFLRSINFLLSASALLAFWIMARNSKAYSEIDITISYLLLGGAVVLDIYSVIWMLLSDWTMLWLSKQRKPLPESICQFIYSSRWLSKGHNFRRWKDDVDCGLEELIFKRLLDMRSRYSCQDDQKMILAERGDHALENYNRCSEKFGCKGHNFRRWKEEVDCDLEELIFKRLLDMRSRYSCQDDQKMILAERASSDQFRDSVNKERVALQGQIERSFPDENFNSIIPEAKYLHEAHLLFRTLKLVFADYTVPLPVHRISYGILQSKDAAGAFNLIEVEVGFMFDLLFTKVMTTVCPRPRIILRFINFLSPVSALIAFSSMTRKSHTYSKIDIIISYLLLFGAVVLEIYSAILMFFSDWAMLWLSKQRKPPADSFYRGICSSRLLSFFSNNKRWKASMAQNRLTDYPKTSSKHIPKLFSTGNIQNWEVVVDLKELIFKRLLDMRSRCNFPDHKNDILEERGGHALRSKRCDVTLDRNFFGCDKVFDEISD